ncbi:hypothetical protein [Paraflavitalea speifideiaquila]|uniref:hypothetical protein n=1 Tax=Paraflavitalea speifideaquila TaxID=3076558 RepID=UPI0028E427E2
MLGYGWLRQAQDLDQVAVDAGVGFEEVLDDGDTGGMRQGLHHGGELVLLVGKYFGFGQAHVLIASLQYYDNLANTISF